MYSLMLKNKSVCFYSVETAFGPSMGRNCVCKLNWGVKLCGMFGLGEMAGVTGIHKQEARIILERTLDPSVTPTAQKRKGHGPQDLLGMQFR